MKQSTITVEDNSSEQADLAELIVTVRKATGRKSEVLVGYPGLESIAREMYTGDAILFETPNDGVLEVRIMSQDHYSAKFLISQVSPRPGFTGGLISDDPNNHPFTPKELEKIAESIVQLQTELTQQKLFMPEQLDLVIRKLDDIQAASHRLGRKDWMNYVVGALTSLCVSAAFTPEARSFLFKSLDTVFGWLFNNALNLLS